jgi:hypothetical protein
MLPSSGDALHVEHALPNILVNEIVDVELLSTLKSRHTLTYDRVVNSGMFRCQISIVGWRGHSNAGRGPSEKEAGCICLSRVSVMKGLPAKIISVDLPTESAHLS